MSAKTTPQYIGLDVGTTSLKGALIDASGTFLAIASVAYGVSRPRPGWSEQDPADYASAAIQCIRQLIASPHADPSRIAALCSSGQAPTLVLLDRDRSASTLVQVLAGQTLDVYQPIHAVYYRNTAVSSRISSFVDYLADAMAQSDYVR